MSRQILCPTCAARPLGKYSGEGWKKVFGLVHVPCVCDSCNTTLPWDAPACALSIFMTDGTDAGQPGGYYAWEHEFLGAILHAKTEEYHG